MRVSVCQSQINKCINGALWKWTINYQEMRFKLINYYYGGWNAENVFSIVRGVV